MATKKNTGKKRVIVSIGSQRTNKTLPMLSNPVKIGLMESVKKLPRGKGKTTVTIKNPAPPTIQPFSLQHNEFDHNPIPYNKIKYRFPSAKVQCWQHKNSPRSFVIIINKILSIEFSYAPKVKWMRIEALFNLNKPQVKKFYKPITFAQLLTQTHAEPDGAKVGLKIKKMMDAVGYMAGNTMHTINRDKNLKK